MQYEPIIGLEIHVELKTKSKMFCGCPADHFAKRPNTQTCPVCLGLPGALPVPNKKAVEWTILLGLALGGTVANVSKFDRKNYFYPDLPKGYQISQYDQPLCRGGKIATSLGEVRIHRVHLEEDTGKLQHTAVGGKKMTLVDFNRSGVPLVEIVTEPDIHSAAQAKEFLKKLHQIVRYLGISDADMEKGSMRLEPNISLKVKSEKLKVKNNTLPPYKVEVKNINSFKFAAAAIEYEMKRQAIILDQGDIPLQETRGWDEARRATVSQRSKEEAADYRYFPEPDIPPMRFTHRQISDIARQIGELPELKRKRFIGQYDIRATDAAILTDSKDMADYFEEAVKAAGESGSSITPQGIANWIINKKPDTEDLLPATLVKRMLEATHVNVMDTLALESLAKEAISANSKAVADYASGKTQALMFLVGQVMKRTRGMATPDQVRKTLERILAT